ncbi:MAG TPA: galactose-1-phosphate uridylyltransferase [Candidatus Edwardsbacteria bacterium]|nr:galactose-1-phosphate uridylyltransferase [Candidatus Edwardsbacteria bacterium]
MGRWVIISTERSKRPMIIELPTKPPDDGICPFCPGSEGLTPPEIMALRDQGSPANGPGWRVRVVPNKFPALSGEGEPERQGFGMYDMLNGVGAHEVIIETPRHDRQLADLEPHQIAEVLQAYVARMQDLKRDTRLKYLLVFKNQGVRAGASLEHSHSQIIATPIVPKAINEEMTGARQYFEYKERCVFCDIVKQELDDRRRLVSENGSFISIAPFAPRFPFETWIMPKRHRASFEDTPQADLALLAAILKDTLLRTSKAVNNPPYNFVIHTAPCDKATAEHYHWHIEIMPRITRVAGFERGTGFYINPTPPEESARFMKELQL